LAGLGYVDDARFAEAKAASLHRRGTSPRMIRALLAAKGVDADTATAGLAALDAEDLELAAAVNLARRRRLGPFRPPETRAAWRERDTATLARAGFAWEVVRRVVEAEDDAALAQP
jgi:regulatory protein